MELVYYFPYLSKFLTGLTSVVFVSVWFLSIIVTFDSCFVSFFWAISSLWITVVIFVDSLSYSLVETIFYSPVGACGTSEVLMLPFCSPNEWFVSFFSESLSFLIGVLMIFSLILLFVRLTSTGLLSNFSNCLTSLVSLVSISSSWFSWS